MSMTGPSNQGADGGDPSVGAGATGYASMVGECDLPSFMVSLPGGVLMAVSPSLVSVLDRAEGELVGRPILVAMSEGPTGILDLLAAGSVDGVESTEDLSPSGRNEGARSGADVRLPS